MALREELISQFERTRTRYQRLQDAKMFSGWVRQIVEDTLLIEPAPDRIAPGQVFGFDLQGLDSKAICTAKLIQPWEPDGNLFRIEGVPKYFPSRGEARLRVNRLACLFTAGTQQLTGIIEDVSVGGIGLWVDGHLDPGTDGVLVVHRSSGDIIAQGKVRYCREFAEHVPSFRVGIALRFDSTHHQVGWIQFVEQAS